MTYQFVPAAFDYGPRKGPALALLIHMAEGGGTVGYLSRNPDRGVSVHFVCEYSGAVVQMLSLAHASGSVNPGDIRSTNDPDGFFGVRSAQAVLGGWSDDPNSAVISIEIEGFAKDGPNAAQVTALTKWAADMTKEVPSLVGAIGHRDLQDYKPCPGKFIPWAAMGGHGRWANTSGPITGDPMPDLDMTRYPENAPRGFTTIPGLKSLRRFTRSAEVSSIAAPYGATVDREVSVSGTGTPHGAGFLRLASGGSAGYLVLASEVVVTAPVPPPPLDCSSAVAAEHERTRQAAITAVEGI